MKITKPNFMYLLYFLFCFAGLFSISGCFFHGKRDIRVSEINPRYWEYDGKPVLLLGGSDEDNLFNNPELMQKNLDILADIGGNYIRGTLSCRDEGNVWPYVKNDNKYNLDEFNPEFWNRLVTCIHEAEKRDVIVQIEFWATFDYYRENWLVNPFNPANNSNYTTENTNLETEWDFHPARKPQPFFFSAPTKNNDTVLLNYQQAFVRKVLDVTLPYSNVLYALDNETRAPAEWALYWGKFIKDEAEKRGKKVNLTEMWDQWDITHDDHSTTYKHPEIFSFTDVSQNNWQEGQTHYDSLLWYRDNLKKQPGGIRPMNNVKVYARLSGGRPNDYTIGVDRWWQNIFAGCASTRFHRPDSGSGLDETAQKMIRAARVFTSEFDIFSCEPHPELLSAHTENEAYCLANPGKVYAVYFPNGGKARLEASDTDKGYKVRWFDIEQGEFTESLPLDAMIQTEVKYSRDGSTTVVKKNIILESPESGKVQLALAKYR
ncbi:MAG: hypothetical protein JXB48_08030 [Candidatus Latescibacteria bacterium]|nr:hypothetical protein [Candidatus Latescibacterota bacterium]